MLVLAPLRQPVTAQTASRYALTAALVDHGTVRIDAYRERLSADFAEKDGHLYSDKAPGQPFAAVPVYALHRLADGARGELMAGPGYRGVWWAVLWSATLPVAAIAGVATFLLHPRYGRLAPLIGATTVVGTLLLPFGSVLFGHAMAAALIGAAATLALWPSEGPPGTRRLVVAGAAAGAAVVTEYAVLWLAAGLLAWVVWVHRARAAAFIAGAVPFALGLMTYLWIAFGSPFVPSYRYANMGDHTQGIGGIRPPDPDTLLAVVAGPRGLVTLTPVVVLAVAGLVMLAREGEARSRFASYGLYAFAVLFVLQVGWSNPTGGHAAGPRYLVPALPMLAPGVAVAWERWRGLTSILAAWSVATMWLATHVDPTLPDERDPALAAWFGDLFAADLAPALVPLWARLVLFALALGLVGVAAARVRAD